MHRDDIRAELLRIGLAPTTFARVIGLAPARLNEHLRGVRPLRDAVLARVEDALADVRELHAVAISTTGLPPDWLNVAAVKAALTRLASEREEAEAAEWLAARRLAGSATR